MTDKIITVNQTHMVNRLEALLVMIRGAIYELQHLHDYIEVEVRELRER